MATNKTDSARMRKQAHLLNFIITRELMASADDDKAAAHAKSCPYCGSIASTKRGFDSSRKQRYLCKGCHRSFTASTGSELSSTNLPLETWRSFAECYVRDLALRESASRCNVSLKTAWYMRRRLSSIIRRYSLQVKRSLEAIENR